MGQLSFPALYAVQFPGPKACSDGDTLRSCVKAKASLILPDSELSLLCHKVGIQPAESPGHRLVGGHSLGVGGHQGHLSKVGLTLGITQEKETHE